MSVCIIGAGPSGCICAYFLLKAVIDVTLFEDSKPLGTILPTGGGRCNLAHSDYDIKELAQNYPRGEKFLYSVFSKFSTYDTINLFSELGIETYTQDNGRIFPKSNSSKEVREKILKAISSANIIREHVTKVLPIDNGYKIVTNKAEYYYSDVVIAIGGGKQIEGLNHTVIPFKPSLVGLNTTFKSDLSGIVLKNIYSKDINETGDLLFTHFGISGPLVYKISSIKARENFPYKLSFNLHPAEFDLQSLLNENPQKEFKNVLSLLFPNRFSEYITSDYATFKAHQINGKIRDEILDKINNYEITITGTNKGEETVTSGGYDLNEINPKTLESKTYPSCYIIGEALNIDGFCGGYNLQNAWSTAYLASDSIKNKICKTL